MFGVKVLSATCEREVWMCPRPRVPSLSRETLTSAIALVSMGLGKRKRVSHLLWKLREKCNFLMTSVQLVGSCD